jgi:Cu(I)/Ag(I) efflux system membrane protein CusA/SilA
MEAKCRIAERSMKTRKAIMVEKIISLALRNRLIVLVGAAVLFAFGFYSVQQNPVDAIPDLSENQVIVFTEWMGRAPQVMEDQVTYPLVSNLQGIPKVKNIRGTSMFGMSFVYIIFDDNVDIYWARSGTERLNPYTAIIARRCHPTLTLMEQVSVIYYGTRSMQREWISASSVPCRIGT